MFNYEPKLFVMDMDSVCSRELYDNSIKWKCNVCGETMATAPRGLLDAGAAWGADPMEDLFRKIVANNVADAAERHATAHGEEIAKIKDTAHFTTMGLADLRENQPGTL